MPLFGFRTHKKYDKDSVQTETAKANLKKSVKGVKVSKEKAVTKAVVLPETRQMKTVPSGNFSKVAGIIIRPHITEKTGILSQTGTYTFEVDKNANKQSIMKAIKELYKVNPIRVSTINVIAKNIFVRGKKGSVPGMKKAIVTVKKGEKIDFV
jgi:large subunit ribosomal protein L23